MRVTWDANMGDGRYFEVYRSLDRGQRTLITSCHAKSFTDASVPAGTEVVGYDVVAVKGHRRSQLRGSSLQLFGFSAPATPELRVA
jgi:hypothetical protein